MARTGDRGETTFGPPLQPPSRGRVTIRDVARMAGVSIGTVSAVINDSTAVATGTRRHILTCIATLGFEPNGTARSLRSRRVASVGFIVPTLCNPFFAAVAEGIQAALTGSDILLVLCITEARIEREDYYAKLLRTQRLDGVIYLSGTGLPSTALLALARCGPVVFVDERLPGLDVPSVTSTNLAGAKTIATHVMTFGHRRIAIVGGPARLWTSEQRLAGYREAIAASGLDPDLCDFVEGDYTEHSGYGAAAHLLDRPPSERPTAILCANDLMAMGTIRRCRDLGLAIPLDVSVTGFDDIPASELLDPPLTTVAQPGRDMGEAAARLLVGVIGTDGKSHAPPSLVTVARFRGSVARPRPIERRS